MGALAWRQLAIFLTAPIMLALHLGDMFSSKTSSNKADDHLMARFALAHFYYGNELMPLERDSGYLANHANAALSHLALTRYEQIQLTEALTLDKDAGWQAKFAAWQLGLRFEEKRLIRDMSISPAHARSLNEVLAEIPSNARPDYMAKDSQIIHYYTQLIYGPHHRAARSQAIFRLTRAMVLAINRKYRALQRAKKEKRDTSQLETEVAAGLEFFNAFFDALAIETTPMATRFEPVKGLSTDFRCPTIYAKQTKQPTFGTLLKLLHAAGEGRLWLIKEEIEKRRAPTIRRNTVHVAA